MSTIRNMPGRRSARSRAGLVGAVLVTAVIVLAQAGGVTATPRRGSRSTPLRAARPNIVMVMTDDMRVDELRFMPFLNGLVRSQGLTFENSFAPDPICCPDRASFLTGRYVHNHHVYSQGRPYGYGAFDDSRTLATSLRAVGYATGFIGKYLNGYGPMRSKVSGRPSWRYVPRGWTDWRAAFQNPGVRGIHGGTFNYMDTPFNVNGTVDNRYRGRYQSGVIGDFSVAMARRFHRSGRPFFMYVNFVAPHTGSPHESDDRDHLRDSTGRMRSYKTPARPAWVRGRFNAVIRRGAGMPKNGGPSEADVSDKRAAMRSLPEPSPAERTLLRNVTRQRAESLFVVDQQVRRLVGQLRGSGEWANTVLMFTSDNGYFLGEHRMRGGKRLAHEPSLRVPFLVTGPGMRSGTERFDPISTVDVAATVLDLANAAPPRPPDGASRLVTMRQGDRGWSVPVVTAAVGTAARVRAPGFNDPRTSIGLRTARYSLIRYRTGRNELYDLVADPLENQNVFYEGTYRPVLGELNAVWWAMRNCLGAQCRRPLPPGLQAPPAEEASMTLAYWREIDRVYGW